jgi:hypothetical protein
VMKALGAEGTTMPVVIVLTNLTMAPHPTWAQAWARPTSSTRAPKS